MHVIETERLLLEPLDVSRREDFVALTASAETMRYWWPNGPFTREVAEKKLRGRSRPIEGARLYRLTRAQWESTR